MSSIIDNIIQSNSLTRLLQIKIYLEIKLKFIIKDEIMKLKKDIPINFGQYPTI